MKIERKGEVYGSFTVEFSERLEAQMRKVANEIVASVNKDPAKAQVEADRLVANYHDLIESSVSLLLSIIGLGFSKPAILNYVFATLKSCLEPLSDHLKREARIQEEQNRQNN